MKTGQRKTLIRGGSDAQYVETGHLIFAAAGALRAVRFDPVRLEVLGDPVTVVEHVMIEADRRSQLRGLACRHARVHRPERE